MGRPVTKGVPFNLMRGKCRFCGRTLRYANIPNRGPVMAHGHGEAQICARMQQMGNDLISRAEKAARLESERQALRRPT